MNAKSLILGAALAGVMVTANAKDSKPADAHAAATGMGECHGINACKGQGECGGPEGNACKGTNSCKGKGWVSMAEKDCKAKKGTWKANKG